VKKPEDASQANGVKATSEDQAEEPKEVVKEAPADTAAEKTPAAEQETQKPEPAVPEASEPSKAQEKVSDEVAPDVAEETTVPEPTVKADEDASEIPKDVTAPEPSVESKTEPAIKESMPAAQRTQTKSDTVDIDFASLNLS
jgi:hypothetical protein